MPRRRNSVVTLPDPRYADVLKLWTLRLLLHCGALKGFAENSRFGSGIHALLALPADAFEDAQIPAVRTKLERALAALEQRGVVAPLDTVIARNTRSLADRLGLSAVEHDILHFTVLQRLCSYFDEVLDHCGQLSRAALLRILSTCLQHPLEGVRRALDDGGTLARSSLLWVDSNGAYSFSGKLEMLDGLSDNLTVEHESPLGILGCSIVRAPAPGLVLADYPHLAHDIEIARGYLLAAARRHVHGVNVLLHGRPGTGKTELVRALVRDIGGELLEIPVEEPGGKPRAGLKRFESFRFAQSLLAHADSHYLLFDEVEDVFCEGESFFSRGGNHSGIKGWVNRLLETNPVPAFWVTNHLDSIDAAYRRRFDLVIEVGVPPVAVRRRIVSECVRELPVDERWKEAAASHPDMAPAIVGRAARVGAMVLDADPGATIDQVMTRIMNNTLEALGRRRIGVPRAQTAIPYDLQLLNADVDLGRLREGLRTVGAGRLLLSGPPGTGKTAFGRHVAETLGRPLLVRRASDILSPYVGEAEQNIAAMFRQAADEGAVLQVDEADSLLQDRRGAVRSWEVTQVNEMLTQMEDFGGVFIATTNLFDSLDAAAMRRFDTHVRLGYLRTEQAERMFGDLARQFAIEPLEEVRQALWRLDSLTPGDFAALLRMCRLAAPQDERELLERLRRVCGDKREARSRPMGFAA